MVTPSNLWKLGLLTLASFSHHTVAQSADSASASTPVTDENLSCFADDQLCVNISRVNTNTARVTIRCQSSVGWCSIGHNDNGSAQMAPSTVYVLWNDGSDIVLSQREATSRSLPQASDNVAYRVVDLGTTENGSMFGGTFTIDITAVPNSLDLNQENTFIYAVGDDTPSGSSPSTATFNRHTATGNFQVNPSEAGSATGGGSAVSTSTIIHGALMIAAWLFLTPAGIFVARFLKPKLGVWWFRLHLGLLLLAVIATIAAYVVIFTQANPHFSIGVHSYVGIAVLVLSILQVGLGFVIDRLFDPKRMGVPWWDMLHWWAGRLIFVLAVVAIGLGIAASGAGIEWWIAFGVLLAGSLAAMVFGQVMVGQQHHKE